MCFCFSLPDESYPSRKRLANGMENIPAGTILVQIKG